MNITVPMNIETYKKYRAKITNTTSHQLYGRRTRTPNQFSVRRTNTNSFLNDEYKHEEQTQTPHQLSGLRTQTPHQLSGRRTQTPLGQRMLTPYQLSGRRTQKPHQLSRRRTLTPHQILDEAHKHHISFLDEELRTHYTTSAFWTKN